ncbi:hypothetical protein D3C87_2048280 [compost metagenome]
MDALGAIDDLRHAEVGRDAHERIGIVARESLLLGQQVDHVAGRVLAGFVQVLVEAMDDPAIRRFQQRRRKVEVLAQDHLEQDVQ